MSTLAEHLREQMIAAEMADDFAAAADYRAQLMALAATAAPRDDIEHRS